MKNNILPWEVVKHLVHDISGIQHPHLYVYKKNNGVFYPLTK
jgi:hypothetical protein